eukprot:sb/3468276/
MREVRREGERASSWFSKNKNSVNGQNIEKFGYVMVAQTISSVSILLPLRALGNEVTPCQRAQRSPGDLSVRCLRYQYVLAPTGALAWWGNFITKGRKRQGAICRQILIQGNREGERETVASFVLQCPTVTKLQEPTETSKQPISARYLGQVTGHQPIRDQYFLIRSESLNSLNTEERNYGGCLYNILACCWGVSKHTSQYGLTIRSSLSLQLSVCDLCRMSHRVGSSTSYVDHTIVCSICRGNLQNTPRYNTLPKTPELIMTSSF